MSTTPELDDLLKQARRCVRKRSYTEGVELFEQALQLDPERPEIHEGLATAHFLAENYEQAAAAFTRLTELTPRSAKAFVNLGAVYNRMGEYSKAADVLRRGLQCDRKCSEAYYNLGIAYRRVKEFGMAVTAYKEAIRLNPEMVEAVLNLANVYLEMGNHQQAITEYRNALTIRPDFERAQQGLKQAEQASAQAKAAVNPFGRLVGDAPPPKKATADDAKELTERQRQEDRAAILDLSVDIVAYGKDFAAVVSDELEPALLGLNRTLLLQDDQLQEALPRVHADFKAKLARCREKRAVLKGKILELKSHEEYIETVN